MASVDSILEAMEAGSEIRFADLKKVCDEYFGEPRIVGSHHVYRTKWQGKPFVNIQRAGGKAKRYQVKQVLEAIAKLEEVQP